MSLGTQGFNEMTIVPGLQTMAAVSGQGDGTATSLPVTIANTAGVPYQITGVAYSGPDAGAFSGTPALPLAIPAGGSQHSIPIHFRTSLHGLMVPADEPLACRKIEKNRDQGLTW